MLQITVPANTLFDEKNQAFIDVKETTLQLEHSLVSLSKWESKWCKAFLSEKDKTHEETIDYIRCMTLTPNVNPAVYLGLTPHNIDKINQYIKAPMTATVFYNSKTSGSNREVVTSELIYYWMIAQGIPFECQKWHLNRLLTLIRICKLKNTPPKNMSGAEIMRRNAALNASRKAKWNTKG